VREIIPADALLMHVLPADTCTASNLYDILITPLVMYSDRFPVSLYVSEPTARMARLGGFSGAISLPESPIQSDRRFPLQARQGCCESLHFATSPVEFLNIFKPLPLKILSATEKIAVQLFNGEPLNRDPHIAHDSIFCIVNRYYQMRYA